jgi:hypothetical protein
MSTLLTKLNFKGQKRIAIINAEEKILELISKETDEVTIDREIDPRYPYSFIILFVKSSKEVRLHTPMVAHNLMDDGVLWFCYPKKSSKKYKSDIDRDHGWEDLNKSGLHGIRMVSIDEDWSAMRFRNIKYIKSNSGRFTH